MKLRILLILALVGIAAGLVAYLLRPKPITVLVQVAERGRIVAMPPVYPPFLSAPANVGY